MSGDAFHITMPDASGSGAVRVMQKALQDAKVQPEEVDYINAHGTSTPYNDKFETMAIKKTFGEHAYKLPISSTKSMTGICWAQRAGSRSLFSALHSPRHAAADNQLRHARPECDLDYVPNKAREAHLQYALSNSFGFGGRMQRCSLKDTKNERPGFIRQEFSCRESKLGVHSSYLLKSSAAFVPPNPKLFESAYCRCASRALFGT